MTSGRPPMGNETGKHTCFEEDDLIVLRQLHEAGHHFGEFDDLLDDGRQLLRAVEPQLLVGLKRHGPTDRFNDIKDFAESTKKISRSDR